MRCNACGKELKTHGGYRRHIKNEAFDYTKRVGFWDEFHEAQGLGYEGTPNEYASGRVTGRLGLS